MNEFQATDSGVNNRRNFLKKAGVAAGAAWVAPTVLSQSAFAQGSGRGGTVGFSTAENPFDPIKDTVCGGTITLTGNFPTNTTFTLTPSAGTTITAITPGNFIPTSGFAPGLPSAVPVTFTHGLNGSRIIPTDPATLTVSYTC